MQNALRLKDEVNGSSPVDSMTRGSDMHKMRSEFWKANTVSRHLGRGTLIILFMIPPLQWEAMPATSLDAVVFPPPDLICILVDHFFGEMSIASHILHRPTFMKQLHDERHRYDIGFARLLLTVCGVAARFCKDKRVCMTSSAGKLEWRSAGSKYLIEAHNIKGKMFRT